MFQIGICHYSFFCVQLVVPSKASKQELEHHPAHVAGVLGLVETEHTLLCIWHLIYIGVKIRY